MIKLYGLDFSFPVNRVRLCLNALGKDYEFILVSPRAGDTRTDEYLKISPAGKIPAIQVDGVKLFESHAIMKYLCRKYESGLYPSDIETQARVDAWCDFSGMHVANGIGKVLFNKILAPILNAKVDEQSMQDGYDFIKRFYLVLDKQLGDSEFLAGETLSIADLSLLATVDPSEVLEVDLARYPNLDAWYKQQTIQDYYLNMHESFAVTLDAMIKSRQEQATK